MTCSSVELSRIFFYAGSDIIKDNGIMVSGAQKFAWALPNTYLESYHKLPSVPMEELYRNMSYHLGIDWNILYSQNLGSNKCLRNSLKRSDLKIYTGVNSRKESENSNIDNKLYLVTYNKWQYNFYVIDY